MRILYLMPYSLYQTKMSASRRLYPEAVAQLPGVDMVWSGIGWPGYDESKTVKQNLGDADCAYVYKGKGLKGLEEYPVRLAAFNEAHEATNTVGEIVDAKANLVVFHHEQEYIRFQRSSPYWPTRFVHIPHCASRFSENEDRPIDCLVTGVLSEKIYPLRCQMARLIKSGRLPGEVRPHPGYRLKNVYECRKQHLEYLEHLSKAKIILACTSICRYELEKLIDAMASGALLITDLPNSDLFRNCFGDKIVQVLPDSLDEEIVRAVQWWLDHPKEARRRAWDAQDTARQFDLNYYARQILSHISSVLNGRAAS